MSLNFLFCRLWHVALLGNSLEYEPEDVVGQQQPASYWHPSNTLPILYWHPSNTLPISTPYQHLTKTLAATPHQHPSEILATPNHNRHLATPHQHSSDTLPATSSSPYYSKLLSPCYLNIWYTVLWYGTSLFKILFTCKQTFLFLAGHKTQIQGLCECKIEITPGVSR
jgi:hypothetical protein